MCGLSLAWVTCENSTSTSNADILSRSSSLDPILFPTVSGVRCWLPQSVVPRQLSLSSRPAVQSPTASQLLFQPTLIRVPFPLPDTVRFYVQESFVWFRAKTDKGIVCFGGPSTLCYSKADQKTKIFKLCSLKIRYLNLVIFIKNEFKTWTRLLRFL